MPLAALLAALCRPVEAQMAAHDLMGNDPLARQIMRKASQPGSGVETIVRVRDAEGRFIMPLRLDPAAGSTALNGPRPIGAISDSVLSGLAIVPRLAAERIAGSRKPSKALVEQVGTGTLARKT